MSERRIRSNVAAKRTGTQSPPRSTARAVGIPDDSLIICLIVGSYLSAAGPHVTLGQLTEAVRQILLQDGYTRRCIEIAFNKLVKDYSAPLKPEEVGRQP